jgi:RHS repeat-associated protein
VDAATNHITGTPYAYDANGNMTNDGNNTLVYDAENRVLSATNGGSSGSYSYDGNSLRVQKVSGGTTTIYIFAGSKVIAEYSGTTSPYPLAREYIYSGGALLAKIESGATKYYHQDQLSNRVVTDSSGTAVAQLGHYPFGESWYNASSDKLLFTSYERDSESGNDYAMMRSSVNRLARFSSPDLLTGTTGDPQSLNHYTYVLNDPANLIDPFGLDTINLFYCMETEDGPYLCIFSDDSGETTGLPLIKMGGHGGGGGWPSLPKFSKEAFDKCAKQAFGGTTGNIPGTDRSIPGYDAALTVFQASLLTGADPATVAGTMAYESNFNLYTATQFDPGTLSADVGPMQLNTANIGDHTFPYFPGAYGNAVVGQPFNGDVLANTLTGASYLNKLRNHPEKYAAPVYRQGRSANLQLTHPSLQAFFDCLAANAIP